MVVYETEETIVLCIDTERAVLDKWRPSPTTESVQSVSPSTLASEVLVT